MLNVKYIIQTDSTGAAFPVQNPNANGNAWFVKELKAVNSADEEMKSLDKLNTKNVAVFNDFDFGSKIKDGGLNRKFDKSGTIKLDIYKPNYIKYTSNNSSDGLAVFSEIYYEKGWNAYINDKQTDHFPVDYVLRAMIVPAGKHNKIEFKFEPQVVQTGSLITLFSFIGMLLLLGGGIYVESKK
jgi:hypothetical protein